MTRALDALNGSERRHTHFDRVALCSGAELFEQKPNRGRELSLVSGANCSNGRLTDLWLDFSAHLTSMAVMKPC